MNLAVVYQAILQHCQTITGIEAVAHLPQRLDDLKLPVLLLDIVELTPGQDVGTGELVLKSQWELRLMMTEASGKEASLPLLEKLLLELPYQRWGLPQLEPLVLQQVSLDSLTPNLHGYIIWLVEWQQSIPLGDNVWAETDKPLETVAGETDVDGL